MKIKARNLIHDYYRFFVWFKTYQTLRGTISWISGLQRCDLYYITKRVWSFYVCEITKCNSFINCINSKIKLSMHGYVKSMFHSSSFNILLPQCAIHISGDTSAWSINLVVPCSHADPVVETLHGKSVVHIPKYLQ
jgi:hypothetical protein